MQQYEQTGISSGSVTLSSSDLGYTPESYERHMVQVVDTDGATWDLQLKPVGRQGVAWSFSDYTTDNDDGDTSTVDRGQLYEELKIVFSATPSAATIRVASWNESAGQPVVGA